MPIPSADYSGLWAVLDELMPGLPITEGTGFGLLALLTGVFLALGALAGRARARLPMDGVFPALLGFTHLVLRVGALVSAGLLLVYLVPSELLPIVTFVLIAAGAAVGWSTRDVLKDYVAGLVILFEQRLPKGAFISFQGYAGVVEKVGLRATFLRDGMGHRVSVPNRELLAAPLLLDATGVTEQEVTLRIEAREDAAEIREALRDAVLASPWVAAGTRPIVLRDPTDPAIWRVRSRLLHAQFMVSFEGQLLERAEEMLAERRRARETPDDVPD
jgi:small-conductance mechanosensitive channel